MSYSSNTDYNEILYGTKYEPIYNDMNSNIKTNINDNIDNVIYNNNYNDNNINNIHDIQYGSIYDENNGNYTATICAKKAGTYEIHVLLRGEGVSNQPTSFVNNNKYNNI